MTTNSAPLRHPGPAPKAAASGTRDLLELVLGYGLIIGIIWSPESAQAILTPIALALTLAVVLVRRPTRDDLGFGRCGLVQSLWILPAAVALSALSVLIAAKLGTLHPLYKPDPGHVIGYVLWTIYQQFLLQDYFMDRLLRLGVDSSLAVIVAGVLFSAAHMPNLVLAAATLVWGIVCCALFRRYHNIWVLGLAQGLLGLSFAVCVPDSLHHHL
ncbi:MAG: CPBP family intramembrane glutamic endopeptidase, partial [Candidatus Sulfotelmatobacter sp.]